MQGTGMTTPGAGLLVISSRDPCTTAGAIYIESERSALLFTRSANKASEKVFVMVSPIPIASDAANDRSPVGIAPAESSIRTAGFARLSMQGAYTRIAVGRV